MRTRNSPFILFAIVMVNSIIAQPNLQWQKSLGGTEDDFAISIEQTTDGGYIAAGWVHSNNEDVVGNHGDGDYWIVKMNIYGEIEWQKTFGGLGNDRPSHLKPTNDGGYIVAGLSNSNDADVSGNHGDNDFWILKITETGTIQWQKSLGGTGDDWGQHIEQTTDDGYVVAGYSYSDDGDVIGNHGERDYWIVKLDADGSIEWQKSMGGSDLDGPLCIKQTSDEGFIVAGFTMSNDGDITENHGGQDAWVVKLDSNGTIAWQKAFGGTEHDFATWIEQTTDGGYVMSGLCLSNDGDVSGNHGMYDGWIVKLNDSGNIEWQKTIGGTSDDRANSIKQTVDGTYVIAGWTRSYDGDVIGQHGEYDIWVVKMDYSGSIQWQMPLGGTEHDMAGTIQQTTEGGYIVAGHSDSNNGDVSGNHGQNDLCIVKLGIDVGVNSYSAVSVLTLFPNPTNEEVSLMAVPILLGAEYRVYDTMGQIVTFGILESEITHIPSHTFTSGTHIIEIGTNFTQKFMIVKN